MSGIIIIIIILFVIGYITLLFNGLVSARNRKEQSWSDIDIQLKRRYDLIPTLIDSVKGYVKHEKGVLEKVTELRAHAIGAQSIGEHSKAENMLSDALKSLFAVSENYPDLKANENFLELQKELTDTENKIQAARRFYNSTVQDFNTKLQVFPNNYISKTFRFSAEDFFELEESEKEAASKPVEVSF